MLNKTFAFFSIFALTTLMALALYAQSDNAQITGYAKDSTGAVLPGVLVTAINEETHLQLSAVSNDEGYYAIPHVAPGLYRVTAELGGFKRFETSGRKVDADLTTNVSFVLEVGSVTEVVRVESRLSSVRTETATVGKLIDRQQIESSQLNGRNPLFLALFTPGVVTQNPFGSASLSA